MSRVHDALRKAAQEKPEAPKYSRSRSPSAIAVERDAGSDDRSEEFTPAQARVIATVEPSSQREKIEPSESFVNLEADVDRLEDVIRNAQVIPYKPLKEALLVNPANPREAPAEEFRTLRTRLNHMQTSRSLHTVVVTSASPAEGKSFTATNLAVTQAQLTDKRVLLADFDFRRPTVDKTFQIPTSPGITDLLVGRVSLGEVIRRVGDTQLYVMTAGDPVTNPLELLNLKECRTLIDGLREHFDWIILDSPPLLFAADGNLLSTMCDGTILVVRIGTTTFDSVSRAIQSLCENNILGVVVNGARRGELYSKYSYYHDNYYAPAEEQAEQSETEPATEEAVTAQAK